MAQQRVLEGRAAMRHTLSALFLGSGAALMLLLTLGVWSSEMARDPQVRLVVVPLVAAGALLLAGLTVASAVKRLRYGVSELTLDVPPALGGSLAGTLSLPAALTTGSQLSVILECQRAQMRLWWFGGFHVSRDTLTLWREEQKHDPATLVSISFAIPSEAKLAAAGVDRMTWWLRVSAERPRFQDGFIVGVGRSGAARRS